MDKGNEKEKIEVGLKEKIAKGGMIKQMMDTPGFKEVYLPWIEKTLSNYEKNGLIRAGDMTNDQFRLFAGEYRGARIVNNFFKRALKEAERANEKLKEME